MKQSGAKAISVLLFAAIVIIPFQTNAFSLDQAIMNYIGVLKAQIVALKKENEDLKAQIARYGTLSAAQINAEKEARIASEKEESECDASSDEITTLENNLLAYNKETNRLVAERQSNPPYWADDIQRIQLPRANHASELEAEINTKRSQWNRECL